MRTRGLRAWDRWWPIVALGLSGLVLHARELMGGRPYFRDVHQIHVPAKMFLAEQLRHGVLPQWWPWDGGGSALIPQPIFSVFHPTTLLYLLLPFWSAYVAASLCATWLALFGGYALGRSLGLTRPAALVAGALYGLCGYLTCLGEHPFSALAAGTMPWYLAALLEADRRRGAWLVLPGVVMGVMLLAPDPQLAILTTAMGVALAVVRSERPARALVLSVVSPAVGLALAAIQLVPSFWVIPDTERGQTMVTEFWALRPAHLLGLLGFQRRMGSPHARGHGPPPRFAPKAVPCLLSCPVRAACISVSVHGYREAMPALDPSPPAVR